MPDTHPDLDVLFERYRQAPDSHVFAPLADLCRKQGMVDEAIEIVDRGLARHPDYASGHVVRGKCYYDHGEPGEAESSFRLVMRFDPNNLVALKYLGIICADRGDADGARERFKHILALDPEDRDIRTRLDMLPDEETPSDRASADEQSHRAETDADMDAPFEGAPITLGDDESDTSDDMATMTLADIYRSQGYTDKALRIYREVLRRQPDNNEVITRIRAMEGESPSAGTPNPVAPPRETALPARTGPDTVVFEDIGSREPPSARSTSPMQRAAGHAPGSGPVSDGAHGSERSVDEVPVGRPIEEARSYDQFKRWLKNLAD